MFKPKRNEILKKNLFQSLLLLVLSSFPLANAQSLPNKSEEKTTLKNNVQIYNGSTIDKIKTTREITIGFNSSSVPISYKINNTPVGYGIDVCLMIIQNLKKTYNLEELNVKYKEVNNVNKMQEIMSGGIDMECGSTTNNEIRRKNVDFVIPYYISTVKMLTNKNSGIKTLSDIRGKIVTVVKGTTSVDLVKELNQNRRLKIEINLVDSFSEGMASVNQNHSQVFILDDLFLFNELSKISNSDNYLILEESLSVEPLSIMLRKNDLEFKRFINYQLTTYMNTGLMDSVYDKWFKMPIPPNNKSLNIPQSYLLKDVFRLPTDIVGN